MPSPRPRVRLAVERLEPRTVPTTLSLAVAPSTFSEAAGATAATGTVTRGGVLTQPLTVTLTSGDTTELTVPASVTIPAGQASATFPIAAVDEGLRDGPQAVGVSAAARMDGSADPTAAYLGQAAITPHVPTCIAALPDGRWVTAGYSRYNSASSNTYDVFVSRRLADGSPDPTFGTAGTVRTDVNGYGEQAYGVEVLADGSVLVLAHGNIYSNGNYRDALLLKYTPAGVLDATFGAGGVARMPNAGNPRVFSDVADLTVQPDGKIVVVGSGFAPGASDSSDFAVARFNPNGTLDTAFGVNGARVVDFGGLSSPTAVALDADGRIVVAGGGGVFETEAQIVARYTAAGALDPTFGTGGVVKTDLPWGIRDYAYGLVVDAAGRLTTAGHTQIPGGQYSAMLTRYLPSGAVDPSFAGGGFYFAGSKYSSVFAPDLLQTTADGRLVLPVAAAPPGSAYNLSGAVAVFAPDGAFQAEAVIPNTNFGNGQIAVGPSGRVASAVDWYVNGQGWLNRFQLAPAGAVASAQVGVTVTDNEPLVFDLSIAPTTFGEAAGANAAAATLGRYGGDLAQPYTATLTSSDTTEATVPASVTFAAGQRTVTFAVAAVDDSSHDGSQSVTITASGPDTQGGTASKAVPLTVTDDDPPPGTPTLTLSLGSPFPEHAGANAGTATLTRAGGDPAQPLTVSLTSGDTTELTVPASVTVPPNQASVTFPLAAADDLQYDGDQTVTVTAKLAGTTVTGPITFQGVRYGSGAVRAAAAAVLADGRVLLAGTVNGNLAVQRSLANGTADTTWGGTGTVSTDVSGGTETAAAMYAYPDGRVLVAGTGPYQGTADAVLVRYTATGALDTTFDGDGKLALDLGTGFYNEVWDVTVTPAGQIVLGVGVDRDAPTYIDFGAVRLNADGSRDATFGTNGLAAADFAGLSDRGFAVAVQPDGRVLVAGGVSVGNAAGTFGVVRFTAAGALDANFGTGGKASVDVPGSYDRATDLLLRPDGRIVLAGRVSRSTSSPLVYDPALAQLTPAGAPDTGFGANGVRVQGDTAGTQVLGPVRAALQADGRVVVAGTVGSSQGAAYTRLMRFSPAGDQEHAVTGPYSASVAEGVAVTAGGDLYVAYSSGGSGTAGYADKYRTDTTTGTLTSTSAQVVVQDNEPFHAWTDTYTVAEDGSMSVPAATGVLANDVITRPIAPAVVLVRPPTFGTVSLAANGSFTYTPIANFVGEDVFTYKVRDGAAETGPSGVRVTVTPTNDPPTAAADAYTTDEDGPPLAVAATPPAAGTPNLVAWYGFDEGAAGNGPAYDRGLAPADTGRFLNGAARAAGGANGSRAAAAFGPPGSRVTAGDIDAIDSATALTVSLWLNLRDTPADGDVLVQDLFDDYHTLPAGNWGWRLGLTAAPGSSPTAASFRPALSVVRSTGGGSGGGGTIPLQQDLNADNRWVFIAFTLQAVAGGNYFVGDPATPVTNPHGANFNSFSMGGGNPAPLLVGGGDYPGEDRSPPAWIDDVRVYNRVLTLAEIEAIRQHAAPALTLGVLANDTDPDGTDTLAAQLVTPLANGTVNLAADGSFTYTPNPNFAGTDTFTYRASDGTATSNPATVTITVRPRPDVVGPLRVNDGTAQRSRVTGLGLTFDAELDTALLTQPGAFTVRRAGGGAAVGTVTVTPTVVGGQTRVALTFAGANTEFGSLADGRWEVVVNRNFVRTAAGGVVMAADHTAQTHRLFGDANGDGTVNLGDLAGFAAAFGASAGGPGYDPGFDANGDGTVNLGDLAEFSSRFGASV